MVEHPQDYGDLVRLVERLRAIPVRDPQGYTIREQLLAKLKPLVDMPAAIRGGRIAVAGAN